MLKLKDGKVELTVSEQLTKRQQSAINSMSKENQLLYVLSLSGFSKHGLYVPDLRDSYYVSPRDLLERNKMRYSAMMLSLLNNDECADFKPLDKIKGDWCGVEIECFIPLIDGSNAATRRVLSQKLRDLKVTRVSLKSDGSLHWDSDDENSDVQYCEDCDSSECEHCESSQYMMPIEIVILFNRARGYGPLDKLCSVLRELGAKVNKTCGLHVHLDMRHVNNNRELSRIGRNFKCSLPILRRMVPSSRQHNTYCRLDMSRLRGDRYYAVNLTAYRRHRTIEIRLHSGTTDFNKIKNWIEILKVVQNSHITSKITTLQKFYDKTNLPDELIQYLEQRVNKFWSTDQTVMNELNGVVPVVVQPQLVPEPINGIDAASVRRITELNNGQAA